MFTPRNSMIMASKSPVSLLLVWMLCACSSGPTEKEAIACLDHDLVEGRRVMIESINPGTFYQRDIDWFYLKTFITRSGYFHLVGTVVDHTYATNTSRIFEISDPSLREVFKPIRGKIADTQWQGSAMIDRIGLSWIEVIVARARFLGIDSMDVDGKGDTATIRYSYAYEPNEHPAVNALRSNGILIKKFGTVHEEVRLKKVDGSWRIDRPSN